MAEDPSPAPPSASHSAAAAGPLPLDLSSEVRLYGARTDLRPAAETTSRQCMAGAGFAALGFAGVIVGSPAAAAYVHGLFALGAVLNTYKHTIMAQRELASIAMRNVEEIALVPSAPSGGSGAGGAGAGGAEEESHVEDRLRATPELELRVTTTGLVLKLKLSEPAAAWEGAKYAGLIEDERLNLEDVSRSLYLEELSGWGKQGAPASDDPDLLNALLSSNKVVADHEIEVNSAQDHGAFKQPSDAARRFAKVLDSLAAQRAKSSQSGGPGRNAKLEVEQIGKQSLISGLIFLVAGTLYIGRWSGSTTGEAVKDPTLENLRAKWKERLA